MSKTVMLIHGMWGGPWYFEKFKNHFTAKGYRCITPILRHHDVDPNETPDPALGMGTTGLLDNAADLEAEISKLEEKPVLIGHSMGGLLAEPGWEEVAGYVSNWLEQKLAGK